MAEVPFLGWWVGLGVVALLVLPVIVLILLARRIAAQARVIADDLEEVNEATAGLWAFDVTNQVARATLESARAARAALQWQREASRRDSP